MREKPHKTGCLSLHNCRCPNPKKHKLHKQIFIKKKMVHMMPGRPEKTEYNFHNNLKSVFGYTPEGERVWDHTCMKGFQALPSLGRMAGWGMRECGISLCIQTSAAASTPLPLTETVLQKTTETFVFQLFPEFNWFYTFSFHQESTLALFSQRQSHIYKHQVLSSQL